MFQGITSPKYLNGTSIQTKSQMDLLIRRANEVQNQGVMPKQSNSIWNGLFKNQGDQSMKLRIYN